MSQPGIEHWIASGDLRRAASSLVVSYGSDVLATCLAMVRDRAAAEDVTQEVFSEALRGLSTFRGDSSPRTWLLSIARNRCIDHLRARRREPWGGTNVDEGATDPDAHPDESAVGSEWLADRSVVMRALDALSEGDRALVVLRFKNGLEYDELATAFGLREGTVRMRVSRALARMRQVLETDAAPPVLGGAPPRPPPAARSPAPMGAPAPGFGAPPPPPHPAAAPAPAMRGRAGAGGPAGAPAAPVSWWSRLRAWAGLGGADRELVASAPPPVRPIGALGLALAHCEPATPSEALAAKLAALVDTAAR